MFPEKYKHHSRQPKNSVARLASKVTALFKRETVVADVANSWVI